MVGWLLKQRCIWKGQTTGGQCLAGRLQHRLAGSTAKQEGAGWQAAAS